MQLDAKVSFLSCVGSVTCTHGSLVFVACAAGLCPCLKCYLQSNLYWVVLQQMLPQIPVPGRGEDRIHSFIHSRSGLHLCSV